MTVKFNRVGRTVKTFLAFVLILSVVVSVSGCRNDDDVSETESAVVEGGITVTLPGFESANFLLNLPASDGADVLYDRNYTVDGSFSFFVSLSAGTERTLVSVKASDNDGVTEYTVSEILSGSDGGELYIPVNGFVLSIGKNIDGNVSKGDKVSLSGYEAPEYERTEISAVFPSDKSYIRRINYMDPVNGADEGSGIVYLTATCRTVPEVPESSCALELVNNGDGSYKVAGMLSPGEKIKRGTEYLLFCGEYNRQYAGRFYTEGDLVYMTRIGNLSSYADDTAVVIDGRVFNVGQAHVNALDIDGDGSYIFDARYPSPVTPSVEGKKYRNVIISGGKVIYVSGENESVIIPTDGAVALMTVGSEADEQTELGEEAELVLYDSSTFPDRFVKIGSLICAVDAVDAGGGSVVYTSAHGSSAGEGSALAFSLSDGLVAEISEGDALDIPENGYVFAVSENAVNYQKLKEVSVGDTAVCVLEPFVYTYTSLKYTRINGTRYTDQLIIYDGTEAPTTQTNIYGFEISVAADGRMISASSLGDSEIPEGGFVISGHGTSMTAIQPLYSELSTVLLDKKSQTVTFITAPTDKMALADINLPRLEAKLDEAKKNFSDIPYESIQASLDRASMMVEEVNTLVTEGKLGDAYIKAITAQELMDSVGDMLYETHAVENRAVWYRSSEKSDEEVEATVKRLKALNINALYIETWYNGQTIGMTDINLISHNTGVHGDYDALEGFVRIGHEYGLEVHAWVENFFVGTTESPAGTVAADKPEWRCIDKNGVDNFPNEYGNFVFLNPYNRECRDLILDIYRELLENYDIDGLHLDYIRFSEPQQDGDFADFGYNEDIIRGFRQEYNTDLDPHEFAYGSDMWLKWCKFREDIINSFVGEVYQLVRELKPEIWLSAACYPDIYGTPTVNFQNFRNWLENGWIDEIFSMSYGTSVEYSVGNAADFVKAVGNDAFYSTGLSVFGTTERDILLRQISGCYDVGANGTNLFSWGSLIIHEQEYESALAKTVFRSPSVQTYKLNETIRAASEQLISKLKNVYPLISPDGEALYESLIPELEKIHDYAADFDGDTLEAKHEYCEKTIAELEALRVSVKHDSASDAAEDICGEIDLMIKWLEQSRGRISDRIS